MASGYFLYESVADKVNYLDFFQELDLPDTFYSWFVVTELHIWMISARAMAEGDDGRLLRNYLVEALWNDVGQRIKRLGGVVSCFGATLNNVVTCRRVIRRLHVNK